MKTVMMVADAAWPTGFERVARGIGTVLHNSGQFRVIHRGLGFGGKKSAVPEYPYEVRPSGQTPDDPMAVMQMSRWLQEDQPDVVLMIQDIWNQTNYLGHIPKDLPSVGYYPVDTPNLKWSYGLGIAALTEAIPYTTFGAHESALAVRDAAHLIVSSHGKAGTDIDAPAIGLSLPKDGMELYVRTERMAARMNLSGYAPIPHGIDHSKFQPIDQQEARRVFGLPESAFVVLNVNTNQFRKRQDITIRAFAKLRRSVPDALLVMHCMGGNDRDGWDLAQLARLYGIEDRMICTHWSNPNLTDEQMNYLYACADVQINTGGGEGFGLTSCEGALCGIPQLVPDWSATREIWKDAGLLLPVQDYRFEPKYLNTAHAIIDVDKTAELLVWLARNPERSHAYGTGCRTRALQLPTWEDVGQQFLTRIQRVLDPTPPRPMTLRAMGASGVDVIESELLQHDS